MLKDPDYENRCKNAKQEIDRLNKKYRLCESCEELVNKVLEDVQRNLQYHNINRLVYQSLQENTINKRPSRHQYYIKGFIWFLIHTSTFILVCLCKLYFIFVLKKNIHTLFIVTLFDKDEFFNSWETIYFKCLNNISTWQTYIDSTMVGAYILSKIQVYRNLVGYYLVPNETDYTWIMNGNIIFIVLINCISIWIIDWQYEVTPVLFEKVKRFEIYKVK